MYEDYFGLKRPPFKITPDTSLFYDGGKRGDILGALVYAVHRGEGIIKVVGEVGSGKTMLCRMLQQELPTSVEIIYIANPSVSADDILFVIAHELGLPVEKDASKHEVMHMLQDYLVQRHMENKQVVLFIEEAQGMPLETLEEIRLLSNLETDQNKLLQIILFGQPELDDNLSLQSIRQLRERITHSFELSPLTHGEIHKYLNFRMREVGYTGPELISVRVAKKIEEYSGGLLRRINIIADKILLSAFAESTHNLSTKHVLAAVQDSSFEKAKKKSNGFFWLILLLLAALAYGIYESQTMWMKYINAYLPVEIIKPAKIDEPVTDTPAVSVETEVLASNNIVTGKVEPIVAEQVKPESVEKLLVGVDQVETKLEKLASTVVSAKQLKKTVEQPEIEAEKEVAIKEAEVTPEKPEVKIKIAELETTVIETAVIESIADVTKNDRPVKDGYQWLDEKLQESKVWLNKAEKSHVSIQVLMRNKSAALDLVQYLKNDWPLDLAQTYIYEVSSETRSIYRVFYKEFSTLARGQSEMRSLPESVKVNAPYLHSIHRMQKALL